MRPARDGLIIIPYICPRATALLPGPGLRPAARDAYIYICAGGAARCAYTCYYCIYSLINNKCNLYTHARSARCYMQSRYIQNPILHTKYGCIYVIIFIDTADQYIVFACNAPGAMYY
jgi:hypothetical protein